MTAFQVPVIDISPYVIGGSDTDRASVAREIDEACSTVGFMQIIGHGIPASAAEGLADAIDSFFSMPLAEKKTYKAPTGINRGYTAPKSEQLSLSLGVEAANRMNDFFEAFNVGADPSYYPDYVGPDLPQSDYSENIWPKHDPQFKTLVDTWFAEAAKVARILTTIFADALRLPAGFFDSYTDHSLDVLRMNNYALPPGDVTLDGELIGMGEHTDYGIVTLLWADQVRGLQVLGQDGSWNDVSPAPGALLINLGDLTNRWTNEKWKSTLHRVKPPIVDGTIKRRRSAAFFHDGNVDALISTLPGCVAQGETELYQPITVGDHIWGKLNGSRNLVRNDAGTEREAARVKAAQS